MTRSHFVTGATGFVGSGLVLKLVQQSEDKVYCLVRPKRDISAEDRLFNLLETLVDAYNLPVALTQKAKKQIIVIEGDLDIQKNQLPSSLHVVDYLWHIAASLNYEDRHKEEIFGTNIEGTKSIIALAQELKVNCFHYFSTAYVVGKNNGKILEVNIEKTDSNNLYEQSKVIAEKLVTSSSLNYRIFRPSIVIGHHQTAEAINFSGLYGFLRRLVQFKGMMERVQKGYIDNNSVKMCIDPDVPLNLVPIDMVVSHAVKIGLSNSPERIFHLTNPNVLSMEESLDIVFISAGLGKPEFVDSKGSYNWIDEKFSEKVEFYNSYFVGEKIFDRTFSDTAINQFDHQQYAINKDNLMRYCDWYVNLITNTKARKSLPTSR